MIIPKFTPVKGFWIFGYGSLMWKPNFSYLEAQPALLRGYHRSLCVYSIRHRGTPEKPGLVMGLDRGGSCRGQAFLLAAGEVPNIMTYLYKREMETNCYNPKFLNVKLLDQRKVKAFHFLVRRDHEQYTGKLSVVEAAELVLSGSGPKGTSLEYLENTLHHLNRLGINKGKLHNIYEQAINMSKNRLVTR